MVSRTVPGKRTISLPSRRDLISLRYRMRLARLCQSCLPSRSSSDPVAPVDCAASASRTVLQRIKLARRNGLARWAATRGVLYSASRPAPAGTGWLLLIVRLPRIHQVDCMPAVPDTSAVWLRPGLRLDSFLAGAPRLDTALFDVDGVLIDTRRSYRLAVCSAAEHIVRVLNGLTDAPTPLVTPEDVAAFKLAGGFNSDWDAAQLFAALWTAKLREWRGM